ncbi:MAG: hypothetical protein U1E30_06325 [Rhodoblastus sp.]
MIRSAVMVTALLALGPQSLQAAERFEGAWARTARECRDREGPGSGVLINLAGRENGRAAPLFDQYEHHCRVEKVDRAGASAKLSLLCYEFWEDYTANRNGRRESATLTPLGKNRLKIDGKTYARCAN